MGKMKEASRKGRTVLIVSHNAEAIASICDRGILVDRGRIRANGPVSEVMAVYLKDALVSSDGHFDLTNHPARCVGMNPVIKSVVLRNNEDLATASFYSKQPLVVELVIDTALPIRKARVAIAIEDKSGRRLFTIANFLSDSWSGDIIGQTKVQCRVPSLRLGTGRFLVSVSIATKQHGLIDSVDTCGWFDVIAHDCYGTGEPYNPIYGPILEEAKWISN